MKAGQRSKKTAKSPAAATRGTIKPAAKSKHPVAAKRQAQALNKAQVPNKASDRNKVQAKSQAEGAGSWADAMAALAWGLAHPTRANILRFLLQRKSTLCGEIVDQLPLAQSTVSQHLKILRETGWVTATEDGPRVFYSIVPQSVARLKKLVNGL